MLQPTQFLDGSSKIAAKMMNVIAELLLAFLSDKKKSQHGEQTVASWIASGKDSCTLVFEPGEEKEAITIREKLASDKGKNGKGVPYLAFSNDAGQNFIIFRSGEGGDFDRVRELSDRAIYELDTNAFRDKTKIEQEKQNKAVLQGKER